MIGHVFVKSWTIGNFKYRQCTHCGFVVKKKIKQPKAVEPTRKDGV